VSRERHRGKRKRDNQCRNATAANSILVLDVSVHAFLQVPSKKTQRLPWR
jgi:hypothetical protein